ncbi:MAG: hypothetical protein WC560_00615 [Syntrophales bacterium]
MESTVRFRVRGVFPSLVVNLSGVAEIGVQTFAVIIRIDEIVACVVGGIDVDHLDLAEIGLLKELQDLQVVALDEEIFRRVEIYGFIAGGRQGSDARLLDDLEAVGLPWPVHPVAFLSRIYHFSKGQLEPFKVNLLPFCKGLRKEGFELFPFFLNDINRLQIQLFNFCHEITLRKRL